VGAVAIAALSVAALMLAISSQGSGMSTVLVEENLHNSLMSAMSHERIDDASDEDMSDDRSDDVDSQSLADESNFYGNWGHDSWGHHHHKAKVNSWTKQLLQLKAREAARRKKEDAAFFSGVKKAFGAKAASGMMGAFNGKGHAKGAVNKFKLDEKKLAARKAELKHSGALPPSTKQAIQNDAKDAAKAKMMQKKLAAAKARILATADQKKVETSQKDGVVAAALKVAKQMADHKDPVAKSAKSTSHAAGKAAPTKVAPKAVKKKVDLHHMGVIEDGLKMQKLAREARSAHGAKKKELRARVMSLEQDIKGAFAKIDDFGKRAETKFSREEAKEKTGSH